jgi:hypothetical protein
VRHPAIRHSPLLYPPECVEGEFSQVRIQHSV